jgi:hypothetical protein
MKVVKQQNPFPLRPTRNVPAIAGQVRSTVLPASEIRNMARSGKKTNIVISVSFQLAFDFGWSETFVE